MTLVWIFIFSFCKLYSSQPIDFDEAVSLVSADLGQAVILHCTVGVKSSSDLILWYKQKLGGIPQGLGMIGVLSGEIILAPFNKTAFHLTRTGSLISLNILHANKDDEAMYFCGASRVNVIEFSNGMFLSVRDKPHLGIMVLQRGMSDSVPAGASVTLQCSVLSESRATELQVLWFRAAPPQSHPQIIYTHHNSSHQCESGSSTHTCVYTFTKNILSLNDTGTYYCAVALCGKIVFGNGTSLQLAQSVNPLLIVLATALGACWILIAAQAVFICKRTHSKHHSERLHQSTEVERTTDQGHDVEYTALHFNNKKTKSGRRKSKQPENIVYSEVRRLTVTD
ncbi:hypothetical protein KOW79_007016 [Hemibagrus wyckioides]|uniref:Ig-like domain-containing protein n=2 Tax=Hemibagrus wyckioides TaxID=337641 RepID=A0A9D3NUV9_9TELE|nr:hypothetical protein KOW79_007016 [Hemibagrus wyckioides]